MYVNPVYTSLIREFLRLEVLEFIRMRDPSEDEVQEHVSEYLVALFDALDPLEGGDNVKIQSLTNLGQVDREISLMAQPRDYKKGDVHVLLPPRLVRDGGKITTHRVAFQRRNG